MRRAVRPVMRKLGFVCTTLLVTTGVAVARPITAGVDLGLTQSGDNSDNTDPNHTLGIFGRLGITNRVGAQLEIHKIATDSAGVSIRTETILMAAELGTIKLGAGAELAPLILAGFGLDQQDEDYGSRTAHHIEGGLALELHTSGGFMVGTGVRLGGRTIDSDNTAVPIAGGGVALYVPSYLKEGGYRSLAIYAGIRF